MGTTDSPLVIWTLLVLKKQTSSSEYCSTSKEDSTHTESMPKKPALSFARSSRNTLANKRSHMSLLMTEEPSDSHIQTLAFKTPSRLILQTEKSPVSLSSKTMPLFISLEETTLEELVSFNLWRSIQVP